MQIKQFVKELKSRYKKLKIDVKKSDRVYFIDIKRYKKTYLYILAYCISGECIVSFTTLDDKRVETKLANNFDDIFEKLDKQFAIVYEYYNSNRQSMDNKKVADILKDKYCNFDTFVSGEDNIRSTIYFSKNDKDFGKLDLIDQSDGILIKYCFNKNDEKKYFKIVEKKDLEEVFEFFDLVIKRYEEYYNAIKTPDVIFVKLENQKRNILENISNNFEVEVFEDFFDAKMMHITHKITGKKVSLRLAYNYEGYFVTIIYDQPHDKEVDYSFDEYESFVKDFVSELNRLEAQL